MEQQSERFTIFPFLLAFDVSYSMAGGPVEALEECLPALRQLIIDDPTVGEIARIGMGTFSDDWRTLVPISDLAAVDIPKLAVEGGTDFGAALRGIKNALEEGLASLPKGTPVYRPVVFFMSDGGHDPNLPDFDADLRALRAWKYAPEIVTFGFGDDVDETALGRLANRFAFVAKNKNPVSAVHEIRRAIVGSILVTSQSALDPTKQEGLHIQTGDGFTPLPVFEL
ncbi:hypothetical protein Cs7R123_49200 [Catellatospora sp. TT07R-123]|uniref:vWA domain-containing protein n=1 Tax=Catellatospora sp. TT07R-123 TaxID=2733863 RepID=UPI001B1582D3|nr:VWA domain-containing protein [Catellatospora sp. TT07R-123]GHJ47578.1 hypothetical protein Cs7R123_49200 [Catellatospora sp. TT07R-123]